MNLFNRLLNLYGSGASESTPKEDFCTECLAGILNSDQKLRNDFASQVLGIQVDEDFKEVRTQKYHSNDVETGIIDMQLESETTICFLEIKVDSIENPGQLTKYHELLLDQSKFSDKEKYLRYCTLYLEEKDHDNWDIYDQFRWKHIAKFLENKVEKNTLVKSFYQFLEENNMTGNDHFTHEDLIGLKHYREIAEKVNEVFEMIKGDLRDFFSREKKKDMFNQITDFNRVALLTENVISDIHSEVLTGIEFSGQSLNSGPRLVTHLWIKGGNEKHYIFCEICKKKDIRTDEINGGTRILYSEPLANFIEKENQFDEIRIWFRNSLKELDTFKKETANDLDWNTNNS